jgi:hypothetical protein
MTDDPNPLPTELPGPEPLNLRQREVIALEKIADVLEWIWLKMMELR